MRRARAREARPARTRLALLALVLVIGSLATHAAGALSAKPAAPTNAPPVAPAASYTCAPLPIALSHASLAGVQPGAVLRDITNGAGSGNFGWLTWTGDHGVPALVAALTPPGTSQDYVDPDDPGDHLVSVGDRVSARPGVANAKAVRDALERLKTLDITVPVWDHASGSGSTAHYRVASFAVVRLLDYRLPGENRITARFAGLRDCTPPAQDRVSVDTDEDTPVVVTLSASDVDSAALTFALTSPTRGRLGEPSAPQCVSGSRRTTCTAMVLYTPSADYNGSDRFTYTARDGTSSSSPAPAEVTIRAVNDPPIAARDASATDYQTAIALGAGDLLANDRSGPANESGQRLSLTAVHATGGSHGTVTSDGTRIVYTPVGGFAGTASFAYTVCDDGATRGRPDPRCADGTVEVTVSAQRPPVARDLAVETDEDVSADVVLSAADPEGDALTYAIVDAPAHGALVPARAGGAELRYEPEPNFHGVDRFTYSASDGRLTSDQATVTVTVRPVQDAPIARDDFANTDEDTTATIITADLVTNDTDADGDDLTVTGVDAGPQSRGSVSLVGGEITYSPERDFNGQASFAYTISDGNGETSTGAVHMSVQSVNDSPIITSTPVTAITVGDAYSYDVDATDVDLGDELSYSLTQRPPGMAIDPHSGQISWEASAVSDEAAMTSAAAGLGDSAIANFDDIDAGPVEGTYLGRSSIDSGHYDDRGIYISNRNADPLIVAPGGLFWNPTNSLSIARFPFDPAPRPTRDEDDDLTIDLNPGCTAAGFGIIDGTGASGEYADFFDMSGALIERLPLGGSFVGLASVTRPIARIEIYEHANDGDDTNYDAITCYRGTSVHVVVRVEDLAEQSDTQSFTIDVTQEAHPPLAVDDDLATAGYELVETMTVPVDGSAAVSQTVLKDGLEYRLRATGRFIIGGPGYADAEYAFNELNDGVIDACYAVSPDLGIGIDDGVIDELKQPRWGSFNPDHDYSVVLPGGNAPISADYHDCYYGDNSGSLRLEIFAPRPGVDAREDTMLAIAPDALLGNDTDPDGDSLTVAEASATAATNGTVTRENSGITYAPDRDYHGLATFVYRASDGTLLSNVASVQLTVRPVNDPPVAVPDSASTAGVPLTIPGAVLASNDSAGPANEEAQTLTVVDAAPLPATRGAVSLLLGSVVYTPPSGFVGSDSFAYTVCDDGITADEADPRCTQATVIVAVTASSRPPVPGDDTFETLAGRVLTIPVTSLLINDVDPDDDELTVTGVQPVAGTPGTVELAVGTVVFRPDPGFSGEGTFTYTISDGQGNSASATVTIVVRAPQAPPPGACVRPPGLVGWWPAEGDATDRVAGANGELLQGAGFAPGIAGRAFAFDGLDELVRVTNTPTLTRSGPLTVEFWFQPFRGIIPADLSAPQFISKGPEDSIGAANASIISGTPGARIEIRGPVPRPTSDTAGWAAGRWHHVAATLDASGYKLYVDGELEGVSLSTRSILAGTADVLFGSGPSEPNSGSPFNGAVDEMSIYNRALSSEDVQAIYLAAGAGKCANQPPVAIDDATQTPQNTPVVLPEAELLANDSDPDEDALTVTSATVTPQTRGTVERANGNVTYTPEVDFTGDASFEYTISDGNANTATGLVTVTVGGGGVVAGDDRYATNQDLELSVPAPGVLANDDGPDGLELITAMDSPPARGELTLSANGSLRYAPQPGASYVTTFTYRACVAGGGCATASVTITVSSTCGASAPPAPPATGSPAPLVPGHWTPVGGMIHARSFHHSAPLRDGRVFVVGGADALTTLASAELYDPESGAWSPAGSMCQPRRTPAAIALDDGRILVAGGDVLPTSIQPSGARLDSSELYDPATGRWSPGPRMNLAYAGPAVVGLRDGRVMVLGDNQDSGESRNASEIFDPRTMTWTRTPDHTRTDAAGGMNAVLLHDGRVLLAGGLEPTGATSAVEIYDPSSDRWTPAASMRHSRNYNTLVVLRDGRVLSIGSGGGARGGEILSRTTEIYDPVADSWVDSDDPTFGVITRAVLLADGRVLTSGGSVNSAFPIPNSRVTDIYDPARDLWERQPDMTAGRYQHTLLMLPDETILAAGGDATVCTCQYPPAQASAEVFSPAPPDPHYPAARHDNLTSTQDRPLEIPAPGLLANDNDPDGDSLTAAVQTQPARGSVTLESNGSLRYTPQAGATYSDTFAYRACDPSGRCDQARVNVSVTSSTNRPPAGTPDLGAVNEDDTLTASAPGVLANDSDPDGDRLTATRLSGPANGTLAIQPDGSFSYAPAGDYFGADSATYKACDPDGLCSPAVALDLNVAAVNDAPRPTADAKAVAGRAITLPAADLAVNDTAGPANENAQTLTVTKVTPTAATHGDVTLVLGTISYVAEPGFDGEATFGYEVCDDGTTRGAPDPRCADGEVTLSVQQAPLPPVADDLSITADEDADADVVLSATDPSDDPLTYALVDPPAHGTVLPPEAGAADRRYRPDPDYVGEDSFTYRASDGAADSNIATVSVDVRPVNDPPTATDDEQSTKRDTPLTFPAADLVVNDSKGPDNEDAQQLSVSSITTGEDTHGTAVLDGTQVTYTPAAGFTGDAEFAYRVCDDGQTRDAPDPRCADGRVAVKVTRPEGVQLAAVELSPKTAAELDPGQSRQYEATGVYADGSRSRLETGVSWSSADESVATINSTTGLASAVAAGTTSIKATFEGVSAETAVSVGSPRVTSVVLEPSNGLIVVGATQRFIATGVHADGTSEALVAADVAWSSSDPAIATVDAGGIASGQSAGTATITARYEGVDGTADLRVEAAQPNSSMPTVEIAAPTDGETVTQPTEIRGTATDPEFVKYVLELAPADTNDFTTLAESDTPVTGGVLGTLDPTMLLNDLYTVRLTAYDAADNSTYTDVTVQVDRELKLGLFTLSFDDLTIPVSGLDITVTRTYDSRDKVVGDFGVGWRLGVRSARVRANRVQGDGWSVSRFGFFGYRLLGVGQHKVSVTLSDGDVEEFDLTPTPSSQNGPFDELHASYTPRPGTLGTLRPLDGDRIFIFDAQPGPVTLYGDEFEGDPYDPQRFEYTSSDGTRIVLSKRNAVEQITDRNDNSLTIGADGITHSSGVTVHFDRDTHGRITSILDPRGNEIRYSYDANGDLQTQADATRNTTRFLYDRNHNLIEIRDPLGRRAARNEYDDSGRLVAVVDALGKRVAVDYDLSADRQTITDRRGNQTVLTHDGVGNVLDETTAAGTTTHTYDGQGNELTVTDPLGHTITRTFDSLSHLLSETTPGGRTTTFTYDAFDNPRSITEPGGRTTTNTYDAAGNLLTSAACGGTQRISYDSHGSPVSVIDPEGAASFGSYDAAGHPISSTDANGATTTYSYDTNGNRTRTAVSRSTADGQRVESTGFDYDTSNRLIRTVNPDGSTTRTTYDANGRPVARIDELGRATRFEYTATGALARSVFPDGTNTQTIYDASGNAVVQRDQAGRVTSRAYDALNRGTRIAYPDDTATTTVYDGAGQVTSQTDERGNTTTYSYDEDGNRTAIRLPMAMTTSYSYNADGLMIGQRDAAGKLTTFGYDCAQHRTSTTYADGTSVGVDYDRVGRVIATTDEVNNRTAFGYDRGGRLTAVTDVLGATTSYAYDQLGNKTVQTDAEERATRFAYDARGQMTRRTLPLGQVETRTYDVAGNLDRVTDFNGHTTRYAYDALNRLIETVPDQSFGAASITFAYTPTGQRSTMVDSSGVSTYAYDQRGRLTRKTSPEGTLDYKYDAAGNMLSLRSETDGGAAASYSYDGLNRLATATDAAAAGGTTAYAYDRAGNVATVAQPNGVTTTYQYDARDRVTEVAVVNGANTLAQYAYEIGPTGDRMSVVESNGRSVDYEYDALRRLSRESVGADPVGNDGTVSYRYDKVGNRLRRTSTLSGVPSAEYVYDDNDRLVGDQYDDNGNALRTSSHTYGYTFDDRVDSVDGGDATLVYDGDGNRVRESTSAGVTSFLVADRNPTGYAQVVEQGRNGMADRSYMYGRSLDELRTAGGDVRYFARDAHSGVRLLADGGGLATDGYDYDAFGMRLSQTQSIDNPYRYAGEEVDSAVGAVYLRSRYLDTSTGRFLTPDKATSLDRRPLSQHRYGYAEADPVNRTDPSGQWSLAETTVGQAVQGILRSSLVRSFIRINDVKEQVALTVNIGSLLRTALFPEKVENGWGLRVRLRSAGDFRFVSTVAINCKYTVQAATSGCDKVEVAVKPETGVAAAPSGEWTFGWDRSMGWSGLSAGGQDSRTLTKVRFGGKIVGEIKLTAGYEGPAIGGTSWGEARLGIAFAPTISTGLPKLLGSFVESQYQLFEAKLPSDLEGFLAWLDE